MLKNLLTKEYINCNLRLMNDQSRPCRKGRGERGRLARSVWRPAEHIFARYRSHRATLRTSTIQKQMVENRGGVRRETPRTTTGTVALPIHSNPTPSHRVAVSRSDKKMSTMTCTKFIFCAIMRKQRQNYDGSMQKLYANTLS